MLIKNVHKRNARVVAFNQDKIVAAITKAFETVGEKPNGKPEEVAEKVTKTLGKKFVDDIPSVEDVQDAVEFELMDDYKNVAKAYILYRQKKREDRLQKQFLGVSDDLKLSVNAIKILEERYLIKDENGNVVETPAQMFRRVANNIAQAEKFYGGKEEDVRFYANKFYKMMTNLDFLPNSPVIANAGRELGQLAACFVYPITDDMEGILDAVKNSGLIFKTGGGVGYSFSRLRPHGDFVKSTTGISSGPFGGSDGSPGFIHIFDKLTDVIKAGSFRRGASMGILHVSHPDVFTFLTSKSVDGKLENFNISLAIPDSFMKALETDDFWSLINPRTGDEVKKVKAKDIWNQLVAQAWAKGDPGIWWIDRANNGPANPVPNLREYYIESTNPCIVGETEIRTASGVVAKFGHSVPIQELVGKTVDVYCWDFTNANWAIARASNIRCTAKDARVFEIILDDGSSVRATPEHKFLKIIKCFLRKQKIIEEKAIHLKRGDILLSADKPKKVVSVLPDGFANVYNMEVDHHHNYCLSKKHGYIFIKNCSEESLEPYGNCTLASIVVSRFVKEKDVDWSRLGDIVRLSVRFLDNVLDMNKYPLPQIEKHAKALRRIGLGVMGWADLLIELGIPYASNEAIVLADKVMNYIHEKSLSASEELAKERGAFILWPKSRYANIRKLRHGTVTCVAPTGTISILANCSSGIEPIFSLAYTRTTSEGYQLPFIDERFVRIAKERGFYSDELIKKVMTNGNVQSIAEVPEDVKKLFLTANEISVDWHIKMLAAFQKNVSNGVSKTINLPNSASMTDVSNAFLMAYESGCMALSIFRDGCKTSQVLRCGLEGCSNTGVNV